MRIDLQGQVAIVTGGGSGIGRATCVALARAGAHVVVVGRNRDRLCDTIALFEQQSETKTAGALPCAIDIQNENDTKQMVDLALERFGRIDILVCSAGILRTEGAPVHPVSRLPVRNWDEVLDINLRGTFLCNRAVLSAMVRQRSGNIVNLSSISAQLGFAFDAAYSSSKCGIIGFTESLAQEVQSHGVRVHVLVPGAFATSLMHRRWNGPAPNEGSAAIPRGLITENMPDPNSFMQKIPPPSRVADMILQLVTMAPGIRLVQPTLMPLIWPKPTGWRSSNSRNPDRDRDTRGVTGPDCHPGERSVTRDGLMEKDMSQVLASSSSRLEGRVVIVTGGTGGLGLATCRAVVREGASLVVADLDQERLKTALGELAPLCGGEAGVLGLRVDVRSEDDAGAMARATLERFGRIDALVACAGILRKRGTPPKPVTAMTLDEWDEVIDVNLKGIFLTNRAVLPRMIEQREGTIINVSSTSGLTGRAHDGAYCASKFGVNGLTKSIADEVRSYGIKVLAIMPDAIDTPMWEQNHPVPPPGNALPPDHVADLIVFLLTQPRDTVLLDPVIVPLGARRRKLASLTAEVAEPTGSRPKS